MVSPLSNHNSMNGPAIGTKKMKIIHPLQAVSLNLRTVALMRGISPPKKTIAHIMIRKFSLIFSPLTIHGIRHPKPSTKAAHEQANPKYSLRVALPLKERGFLITQVLIASIGSIFSHIKGDKKEVQAILIELSRHRQTPYTYKQEKPTPVRV